MPPLPSETGFLVQRIKDFQSVKKKKVKGDFGFEQCGQNFPFLDRIFHSTGVQDLYLHVFRSA